MPTRRPGRKRKPDARRRNRFVDGRRVERPGPTPEMARRRLAEAGDLSAVEAFGAGIYGAQELRGHLARIGLAWDSLPSLLRAGALADVHARRRHAAVVEAVQGGRPLPAWKSLASSEAAGLMERAESARLDDREILRRWWKARPGVDRECPLDVLEARCLISEDEWKAGMRYGRLVWRIAGLPFHPVERLYLAVGAAQDERHRSDPREAEENDERAQKALRDAVLAVRLETPPRSGALELLGEVAVYFRAPWNCTAEATETLERDARLKLLRVTLAALVDMWGMGRRR